MTQTGYTICNSTAAKQFLNSCLVSRQMLRIAMEPTLERDTFKWQDEGEEL